MTAKSDGPVMEFTVKEWCEEMDVLIAAANGDEPWCGKDHDIAPCRMDAALARTLEGMKADYLELARARGALAVKSAYDRGVCPDCGEDIPDDAPEGYACSNCGHTCYSLPVCEMGLCEVEHIMLKPNQLYCFRVLPGCDKCRMLDVYSPTGDSK